MSITIEDYYRYSQLANAAYINLDEYATIMPVDLVFEANDQHRIPTTLAERMFDPNLPENQDQGVWNVIDYHGNDDSGYAATLFEKNGEKVLAIRGTEPTGLQFYHDLIVADLAQIGFIGFALDQTVSMINHIVQMMTPVGMPVQQLRVSVSDVALSETNPLVSSIPVDDGNAYINIERLVSSEDVPAIYGTGLIQPGDTITVTGHSLGGHLAAMAARLFPDLIADAYLYNAPGFNPEFSDELFTLLTLPLSLPGKILSTADLLRNLLFTSTDSPTELKLTDVFVNAIGQFIPSSPKEYFDPDIIHSVETESSAYGDDISIVSGILTNQLEAGLAHDVPSEGNSHLIEPFMDSLALQSLLSTIDDTLIFSSINNLYVVAGNHANAEENLLKALHTLVINNPDELDDLPEININDGLDGIAGLGKGDTQDRDRYYQILFQLQEELQSNQVIQQSQGFLRIVPLIELNSNNQALTDADDQLIPLNTEDLHGKVKEMSADVLAYRYALKNLNPFVILGDSSIYEQHNLNGELEIYDQLSNPNGMTDQYIEDRAKMLSLHLHRNLNDIDSSLAVPSDNSNESFEDIATGTRFTTDSQTALIQANQEFDKQNNSQFIFGSDSRDTIAGGEKDDHLYGGAGVDELLGGIGNDYIEGNADWDKLDGGLGDDILKGGTGSDFYRYYAEEGHDVIEDADRSGKIFYFRSREDDSPSLFLTGGKKRSSSDSYISLDGKFVYTWNGVDGSNLVITFSGQAGSITVKNFHNYDYGIHLQEHIEFVKPATTNLIESEEYILNGVKLVGAEGNDHIIGTISKDELAGADGNDIIEGDDGVDFIDGGRGDDLLIAGAGNDRVNGWYGNDHLQGGDGNDYLFAHSWVFPEEGGEGDNFLEGGRGSDILIGGSGNDRLYATSAEDFESAIYSENTIATNEQDFLSAGDGNDLVVGGPGNDYIAGGSGNDLLIGGAGNDLINDDTHRITFSFDWRRELGGGFTYLVSDLVSRVSDGGQAGNDTVYAGSGHDVVNLGSGNNVVFGGSGYDLIISGSGNDYIDGGTGADTMKGWKGNDIYFVDNVRDKIYDKTGNGYDIVMTTVDYRLSGYEELEELNLLGTDNISGMGDNRANTLRGNTGNNTLIGRRGDDIIYGGSGDDYIYGDEGNDQLSGGVGNDTYWYDIGDGADIIKETGGIDQLNFGQGIIQGDLIYEQTGNNLRIQINDIDRITISNWFLTDAARIENLTFLDGSALSAAEVDRKTNGGVVLEVATEIVDQTTNEDHIFDFTIPENTFSLSSESGLIFNARLNNDEPLPDWLSFDNESKTFSGLPLNTDVGSLDIKLTATDQSGTSVSDSFTLNIQNTNDAPIIENGLSDLEILEDDVFSFVIPENTFHDDDHIHGDSLTLQAELSNGEPLPAWLNFDSATNAFSGTPSNTDVGNLTLQVTATDMSGESISDTLNLNVINTNDEPVVMNPLVDLDTLEDEYFSFTLPSDTFVDDDRIHGDTLSFSVSQSDGSGMPAWLTYDAQTLTFSGTPGNDDVEPLDLRITATDQSGEKVYDDFTLNVINVNDAPELTTFLADQSAVEGSVYSFTIPGNTFTDIDSIHGDTLNLSATLANGESLPAWLSFDPVTNTFSGTPANADTGILDIQVMATDQAGASITDLFQLLVQANSMVNQPGGTGDDVITGSIDTDTLIGLGGNDTLYGGAGNDQLFGIMGNNQLIGGEGDDLLRGGSGDDLFEGGSGNDEITDLQGNDTYRFGYGDDLDVITDKSGNDQLILAEDINPEDVWFHQADNNLEIYLLDSDDRITVENWYRRNNNQIEQIRTSNGETLLNSQVNQLVNAMAVFDPPVSGDFNPPATVRDDMQATITAAWQ